jgi:2-methylisocitrate lyase-like PEP mutase family enzyme
MTTTVEKFNRFKALHQPGNPIILYNIWDAGSAQLVESAGAKAIATGSHPLAHAQGYQDGENIPFNQLLTTIEQIVASVTVPVSIDFESGYAGQDLELLSENITQLLQLGVVGVNFEDQKMGEGGVYDIDIQVERITTLRRVSSDLDLPLFINARTDLFLKEKDKSKHSELVDAACTRASAYEQAGANSFFTPGLDNLDLITDLCQQVELPLNIVKMPSAPDNQTLARAGVGRISYGPFAYRSLMDIFKETAQEILH